jgi:TonB-dependent receptor
MAGVRLEDTQTDYTQPYLDEDLVDIIGSDAALTGKGGYNNILPSIHLMYRLDNNNNLKLAYSTGLARPRYTSLIPRMSIDELPSSNSDLSGRINYGNPDLEPRTAYNFDLMYDRFSPYLGVISVGLFYKQFKAWQTSRTFTEEHDWVDDAGEDGADGVFETYRASQPVMGDGTATYFGIELNIQQRLLPLSDMLRWFTLNANFTYTYTKGELDGRTVVMTRSPKYITNGSVMYDNTDLGLSVVVALNYRDAILGGLEVTDYGPDKYLDTWFDSEFFVDISVMQKITDKLLIIGQLNGMGSTDERETLGDPRESYSRTQQLEQYGIYGTVGLQYTFW